MRDRPVVTTGDRARDKEKESLNWIYGWKVKARQGKFR